MFPFRTSISKKPTPRFFIAVMKRSASAKGVPAPQNPNLCMYAMLPISEIPVALQYTTRAFGHLLCSSMTHAATLLPVSFPALKFLASTQSNHEYKKKRRTGVCFFVMRRDRVVHHNTDMCTPCIEEQSGSYSCAQHQPGSFTPMLPI